MQFTLCWERCREGPCWDACLANATAKPPLPCSPSCDVETHSLATLRMVRALNPAVTTVLYLNTLLLFPFYKLAAAYIAQGALLTDAETGKPFELRNDDGMPGVLVPDFGTAAGRNLWMQEVEGWLATGLVDGIFADKWPDQAHANHTDNSTWLVCNHVCGKVTAEVGQAFNDGKMMLRENVSQLFRVDDDSSFHGLLYGDGCDGCYSKSPRIDGNLVGPWIKNWQFTPAHAKIKGQNVWKMVDQTRQMLHEYHYKYVYVGCGDHNPSEGKPFRHNCTDDLCTDCTPEGIAIFLLIVEEGVFLGTDGWDPAFDKPLGAPLGPALNVTDEGGEVVALTRKFASVTSVFYNLSCVNSPAKQEGYGCSRIDWAEWPQNGRDHSR